VDVRELSVEGGDDLSDCLSSTGRGGNDVVVDTTSSSPVLVRGSVYSLLGGSSGVDSAHQTLNDTELVVDDLGERGEAVGSARCVRDLRECSSVSGSGYE